MVKNDRIGCFEITNAVCQIQGINASPVAGFTQAAMADFQAVQVLSIAVQAEIH
jgi:hypothetical protein